MKKNILIFIFSFVLLARAEAHVTFTRNDGQIDTHGKADCRFTTSVGGANYFFCADGMVSDFQQRAPQDVIARSGVVSAQTTKQSVGIERIASVATPDAAALPRNDVVKGHALKLNFLNRTNFLAEVTGQDEQEYKCNYFIGNDSKKWHTNVPNYSRIVYNNVWEGIDVVYRSASCQLANAISRRDPAVRDRATLEYDVIVHPGANPNQIQFSYEGQDALSIDSKGNLVLKTSVGDVIEQTPYVYQIVDGEKKEIHSEFRIENSEFRIRVGSYDPTRELVIDPVFSTYLGQGVGGGEDKPLIATDKQGNVYVSGWIESSLFPKTPGAYKYSTSVDRFVTKIAADGKSLIYSTILGVGSSNGGGGIESNNSGSGIAVDTMGNVYVAGNTKSTTFPTTAGAYDAVNEVPGNLVGFVIKLSPSGSNLLYGTYLGTANDFPRAMAVDLQGNMYITGYVQGDATFPITSGAYDTVYKGQYCGFITKLHPGGQGKNDLLYSTFLGGGVSTGGGGPYTKCFDIAADANGNLAIAGNTTCSDFRTTNGAFQTSVSSNPAFLVLLNPGGRGASDLIYSTYLASSSVAQGVKVDAKGNIYVAGTTSGADFPNTTSSYKGGSDAFVVKINPQGQGNSDLVYGTLIGTTGDENCGGLAIDDVGNAYITGDTRKTNFPTTPGAFQTTFNGGVLEAFFAKFNSKDGSLEYSSFLGGSSNDYGTGIASDREGNISVIGRTISANFPTTPGAYDTIFNGTSGSSTDFNAFVTKFAFTPKISVQDTLKFDSVYCSGEQANVLIENLSAYLPLTIDTIMLSGQDAGSFSILNLPQFPLVLDTLGDVQLTIQLSRKNIAGKKMAILNIHSNDNAPGSDTLRKVVLIGVIDSIGILTLKKNISFGQLRCEEASFDTVVQVKNKGLQPARVVPTLSGDGATSFIVTPSSATIAAGATTNFTVHFQPSGNGSFSAHLKFSDDACDRAFDTMYVTGSKISDVSLTSFPSLIDFGEHCHSSVVDSFITVHNTSNATVTLDPAVMSGSGFTVLAPTTFVTLGPDSSVTYHIRFTSSGVGNYQGSIKIGGKPCNISVSNQLRGSEIEPPKITLNPKTVFFDTLDCSEVERFTKVKVKNVGGRTITLKPVIIGDTHSYNAQPSSITIPKNSSFNVKIIFHPDSVGQHSAYLFFDDMLCGLLKDSVSVRGFKSSIGAISGKPVPLHFDSMDCSAGGSDTISLWIKNTGDQILNLNTPTVSGNGFVIENANGVLGLAPLDSIEYRIIFTPGGEGTYLDTFRITGTCGVLFTCPLSGVCDYMVTVGEKRAENAGEFFLGQNHPNPFSHSCQLSVVSRQSVKFEIRDMLGRVVYQTGITSATTQLTVNAGALPNGLYLYSLNDGKNIQSRMMMVVH